MMLLGGVLIGEALWPFLSRTGELDRDRLPSLVAWEETTREEGSGLSPVSLLLLLLLSLLVTEWTESARLRLTQGSEVACVEDMSVFVSYWYDGRRRERLCALFRVGSFCELGWEVFFSSPVMCTGTVFVSRCRVWLCCKE